MSKLETFNDEGWEKIRQEYASELMACDPGLVALLPHFYLNLINKMLTNSSILITGDTGSLDQTDHSWVKLAVQQANVLIFNEATSALDNKTENAVMQVIDERSKALTLIIIAHRLNTLKNCTQIVELCMRGIKQIGAYQQIENVSV